MNQSECQPPSPCPLNPLSILEESPDLTTHGVRDPVHSWIDYSDEELGVINSQMFQRLRWVSQLTGAAFVFPGGTNTRFLHSLGVMHLAGKYFDALMRNSPNFLNRVTPLPPKKCRQLVRLGGMLHDIGHGPFSHAFDATIYQQIYNIPDGGHDIHREKIVMFKPMAEVISKCGIDPEDLIALWSSKSQAYLGKCPEERQILDVLRLLVQGPLGADRMDFTLRDSYFTGTTHFGTISADRIIGNSLVRSIGGQWRLHYKLKCVSDLLAALDGRAHMYENVYFHKTVYAADILIMKMMSHAIKDLHLVERTQNLDQFSLLNDYTIIGEILAAKASPEHSPSEVASTLTSLGSLLEAQKFLKMLMLRKFPKLQREYRVLDSETFDLGKINVNEVCPITPLKLSSGVSSPDTSSESSSESLPSSPELSHQVPMAQVNVSNPTEKSALSSQRSPEQLVIRTKSIGGVDTRKFDKLGIYFLAGKGSEVKSLTCGEALATIRYLPAKESFSFVRVYAIPSDV